MKMKFALIPVAIVALLGGFFAYKLTQPRNDFVQSAMVGQPVPAFVLPPISESRPGVQTSDLRDGKPKLVNFFASWCLPCRVEAPFLDRLEREGATIVAIAISDEGEDVDRFLAEYGNPFARIGDDENAQIQLEFGSSQVPETFVVDGEGVIRYHHIGDIAERDIPVLLRELEKAGQ